MCGGGARNDFLMRLIKQYSRGEVIKAKDGDWIEAMAFAWMAHRHVEGLTANLPSVTGARREGVLGAMNRAK